MFMIDIWSMLNTNHVLLFPCLLFVIYDLCFTSLDSFGCLYRNVQNNFVYVDPFLLFANLLL